MLYSRGGAPGALYSRESVPEQKAHAGCCNLGARGCRLTHVGYVAAWVGQWRRRACEHADGRLAVGLFGVEQQRQRRRTRACLGLGLGAGLELVVRVRVRLALNLTLTSAATARTVTQGAQPCHPLLELPALLWA